MSNLKDSVSRTVLVALVLCVVCSVIVSAAAVMLRDKQQANAINEKKMNILAAAGIEVIDGNLDAAFATITPKLVDMRTGLFSSAEDVATYDMRKAAKDPSRARALTGDQEYEPRSGRVCAMADPPPVWIEATRSKLSPRAPLHLPSDPPPSDHQSSTCLDR